MDKKMREIKRDSHMVDGSQGQVAKVAALPSGPHCLHCHGDDDDDDDDDRYRHDRVDRQLVRMGYRFLVRGCKFL